MGFFRRWKQRNRPRRRYGTGKIWDNINTPGSKSFLAPTSRANTTGPRGNFYTPGPNPEMNLQAGVSSISPFRYRANAPTDQPIVPVQDRLPGERAPRTQQRETIWDAGNPATLRTSDLASQQHFNQVQALPVDAVLVRANGVQCDIYGTPLQTGWQQVLVPLAGMRENEVGTAPPTLLSRPLKVKMVTGSVEGKRSPIKKAKAPARQRGG